MQFGNAFTVLNVNNKNIDVLDWTLRACLQDSVMAFILELMKFILHVGDEIDLHKQKRLRMGENKTLQLLQEH